MFFTIPICNVFYTSCTCLLPVVSWVRGHQKPKHDTMVESNSTFTLLSELNVLCLSIFPFMFLLHWIVVVKYDTLFLMYARAYVHIYKHTLFKIDFQLYVFAHKFVKAALVSSGFLSDLKWYFTFCFVNVILRHKWIFTIYNNQFR